MQYGYFYFRGWGQRAHRVSWIIANGEIPEDNDVLHSCDVPRCVNPAHLFLGNDSINIKDAVAKGRVRVPTLEAAQHHKGEQNGFHKLTRQQVMTIKSSLENGITGYSLAKKYGVDPSTIADIRHGRTWNHVAALRPEDA